MEFENLVRRAFFEGDNQKRKEAENQLLQLKDSNINTFYTLCGQIISKQDSAVDILQAALILIKRCTSLKSATGDYLWFLTDPQTRQNIKTACLTQLISQNQTIMKYAANAVACIASLEIPLKQWPEILNNLVSNSQQQNYQFKKPAIITMGYICDNMKALQMTINIDKVEEQKILFGICQGFSSDVTDEELRLMSIQALRNSLDYMKDLFQTMDIYQFVITRLFENTSSTSVEVSKLTFQCLIEFCKIFYSINVGILDNLLQATLPAFKLNEEIAIPAMEIWNAISNEYKERNEQIQSNQAKSDEINQHYLQFLTKNNQLLIQPLCENLFLNAENEDDTGGLSVQQGAYKALSAIIDVVGSPSHQLVTTFISNAISHQSWQYRKAAIMAFSALSECQNSNEVRQLVNVGISVSIRMFYNLIKSVATTIQDKSQRVRYAAAEALSHACENYPEAVLSNGQFIQIFELILHSLTVDDFKISNQLIWTIIYLTERSPFPQILENQKVRILQVLGALSMNPSIPSSFLSLIDSAFMGIMHIMYSLNEPEECKSYLIEYVKQLKLISSIEKSRREHIESGLLTCLHACLVKMNSDNIQNIDIDEIFKLIVSIMKQNNEMNSDEIYALSGLATCIRKQFVSYCPEVLVILNQMLQKQNEPDPFKAALFCVADIARAIEEDFSPYMAVLDYMIGLISDPNFNRDLKLQVYICIGDIILGCKSQAMIYIDKIKILIQLGFGGCIQLSQTNDPTSLEYCDRLRESLIGFYTCVIHSFCDHHTTFVPLEETVPWIFQFSFAMCNKDLHPTVEFVRMALNCMLDIGNFYKMKLRSQISQFYSSNEFKDILLIMKRFESASSENSDCIIYAKEVLWSLFELIKYQSIFE